MGQNPTIICQVKPRSNPDFSSSNSSLLFGNLTLCSLDSHIFHSFIKEYHRTTWALASIVASGHVPRAILMDTNLGDLASVAQDPKVGDARLTTAALGDLTMGTWGFLIWWLFTSLPSSDSTSLWRYGRFTSMICLWKLVFFFHSQNWQRGHQKNNFDGEHDDKRLDLGVPSSL